MSKRYEDTPVNLLAKEVAKVFGGTHVPVGRDNEFYETWAEVLVPAFQDIPAYSLHLSLRGWGAAKDKVTVSLNPIRKDNDVSLSGLNFPSASFNITRDFQSICSGISKRVVNVAEVVDLLCEFERRKQALIDLKKGLQGHLEDLLKSCPNLEVSHNQTNRDAQVTLWTKGGHSSYVTLYSGGTLGFDRISSLPLDKAKRILAILAE